MAILLGTNGQPGKELRTSLHKAIYTKIANWPWVLAFLLVYLKLWEYLYFLILMENPFWLIHKER